MAFPSYNYSQLFILKYQVCFILNSRKEELSSSQAWSKQHHSKKAAVRRSSPTFGCQASSVSEKDSTRVPHPWPSNPSTLSSIYSSAWKPSGSLWWRWRGSGERRRYTKHCHRLARTRSYCKDVQCAAGAQRGSWIKRGGQQCGNRGRSKDSSISAGRT